MRAIRVPSFLVRFRLYEPEGRSVANYVRDLVYSLRWGRRTSLVNPALRDYPFKAGIRECRKPCLMAFITPRWSSQRRRRFRTAWTSRSGPYAMCSLLSPSRIAELPDCIESKSQSVTLLTALLMEGEPMRSGSSTISLSAASDWRTSASLFIRWW